MKNKIIRIAVIICSINSDNTSFLSDSIVVITLYRINPDNKVIETPARIQMSEETR